MSFDQANTLRSLMKKFKSESDPISNLKPEILDETYSDSYYKIPSVFAISGGKGGIGKTLTTANLGLSLSRMGFRTLLMDTDFGLANLDIILNIRPRWTLEDVLCGECQLKDILLTGPEGIRIMPSCSGVLKIHELNEMHKMVLLDQMDNLTESFDVVLIDTPAGMSKNVQHWTMVSGETILVVTPEPSSVADCYASIKILIHTTSHNQFKLIVNMAESENQAKNIYNRISTLAEEHLGAEIEYLGFIPYDHIIRSAVKERVPYVLSYPFSSSAQCMREIARHLVSNQSVGKFNGTMQFFWRKMVHFQTKKIGI